MDGVPQVAKGFPWHIWVANDVVRLPQQFFFSEPTDGNESRIAVRDVAIDISDRYQSFLYVKVELVLGDGQIGAHKNRLSYIKKYVANCINPFQLMVNP